MYLLIGRQPKIDKFSTRYTVFVFQQAYCPCCIIRSTNLVMCLVLTGVFDVYCVCNVYGVLDAFGVYGIYGVSGLQGLCVVCGVYGVYGACSC